MGVAEHVIAGLALPELVGGVLRLLRRGARGHEEGARGGEGEEGPHLRINPQPSLGLARPRRSAGRRAGRGEGDLARRATAGGVVGAGRACTNQLEASGGGSGKCRSPRGAPCKSYQPMTPWADTVADRWAEAVNPMSIGPASGVMFGFNPRLAPHPTQDGCDGD